VIPGIRDTNPELLEIYGRVASRGIPEKFEIDLKSLGISLDISVSSPAKGDFVAVFENVTERRRVEQEARTASLYARSLIEASLDPLVTISTDGKITDVNKATELVTEVSRDRLIGSDFSAYFTEPERATEGYEEVFSNGFVKDFSLAIRGKSGKVTEVLYNATVYRDENGKIHGVFAAARDVTDRKRTEEKLRESEERYHSLFDRILDGIYLSTHEGRFVDVNPAFVKMFGYSNKQEMLDITNIKKELYFSPEERGSHVLDTGQEEVEAYRMRRKDGSEVWVEDHGGYVHDEQGNIIYHEGILRDITERKRLEEELKRYSLHLEELVAERTGELRGSEEKYRELFEASPISLWEHDYSAAKQFLDELRLKGVSDFSAYFANHPEEVAECAALVKVLDVNKATLNLYNAKSKDELIGTGVLSRVLVTENAEREFIDELVALAEGKDYEAEIENTTLRDETKQCHLIASALPGYEKSLGRVLACIIDLTPQKRLEEELVKSQRLAAIGETASMVGHDLRNPLQGIAGALYLLKQESLTKEERNEMLQVIEKSIHYSDAIIKDLLDYSAEINLELAEATPRSITRDAIEAVKVPQNVKVQDLSEDQPILRVDPDRMKRVFINLIENAIDAMPQGGTLTISSKKFDANVEIAFTDTGFGMSEKVMENLWRPLQTTKAKGMGFGLAICKRIMDSHGGIMSVKSEEGKGTTFTIQLPINTVEVKQK
jgi:PAS domain S-box-containing protein